MDIPISGKFSYEVDSEASRLSYAIRDALRGSGIEKIKSNIDFLVYFPVLLSPYLSPPIKSHRSFSKKENSEFVNVEISYDKWIASTTASKIELLLDGLIEAIDGTNDKKIPRESKNELIKLVRDTVDHIDAGDSGHA